MTHALARRAIPQPLRQALRGQRRFLRELRVHPGLALSRLPGFGELVAALAPADGPPVLVASLPRAGSSWIGQIVGGSDASLYLREPMTQSYFKELGEKRTPIFEWGKCAAPRAYERFARRAFRGIPRFGQDIVPRPEQWSLAGRRRRRVVIKDVNPLVLRRLANRFGPRIVFLVRHPVPVARSFHSLGWTGDQFRTRLLARSLAAAERTAPLPEGFWEQAGAFQAISQNLVADQLAGTDHLVVRYEDVCAAPLDAFGRIFDFCDLPFTDAVRGEIVRTSQGTAAHAPGRYDTIRNSASAGASWRSEVDPAIVARVRDAYFAFGPHYYRERADW